MVFNLTVCSILVGYQLRQGKLAYKSKNNRAKSLSLCSLNSKRRIKCLHDQSKGIVLLVLLLLIRKFSPPRMVLSCPIPAPHVGENFLTPSLPLGAPRSLAPLRKTLLFVNLPYNWYNFFNETYFINKNILEITTKFISLNQINF